MMNIVSFILGVFVGISLTKLCEKKNRKRKEESEKEVTDPNIIPLSSIEISADYVFQNNADVFKDLYEPLFLSIKEKQLEKKVRDQWNSKIETIENNTELLQLWNSYKNQLPLWYNLLRSWGIKRDSCISFEAIEYHQKIYREIGQQIVIGEKYKVVQPYWSILRERADGKKSEEILLMGEVIALSKIK